MTNRQIAFEWIVPESRRFEALRAVEEGGGSLQHSDEPYRPTPADPFDTLESSFEPLIIIASLMGLAGVVKQFTSLWRDLESKGGWIVDVRHGKIRLRELPDVDRGTCIIVSDEGTSTQHFKSENDLEGFVRHLIADR
jgi:hypothetical protein